jgi:ElaB/YqjD/DUF883 family membrane-anchored ribosome-binding protein
MTGPQPGTPAAATPAPDPTTTPTTSTTAQDTAQDTPQDTRREVEELRAELGDTVEELAHRVDVPSRLREKRAETTERVQAHVAQAREVVAERGPAVQDALRERPALVGGIGVAIGYLLLRALRRRKNRKEDADGTR